MPLLAAPSATPASDGPPSICRHVAKVKAAVAPIYEAFEIFKKRRVADPLQRPISVSLRSGPVLTTLVSLTLA